MLIRFTLLLLMLTLPAMAQEEEPPETVVAGLSQNRVSITANFDGSEILIFGAVKREAPPPSSNPLQVIITVSGPSTPVMVRRKAHKYGIWINDDAVLIDAAPSFYAVATSAPWNEVISDTEDLRNRISIPRAIRSVGAAMDIFDAPNFTKALIRIREKKGLYQVLENQVTLRDETLFNTSVALPANLTEGAYEVRIVLTRDRRVVDIHHAVIDVSKVGLERWIYNLAHNQPLIYGFLSLFIAIAAGWGASAVFRYIRS